MAITTDTTVAPDAAVSGARRTRKRLRLPEPTPMMIGGLVICGAITLFGVVAPFLVGSPDAVNNVGLRPPGDGYLLGTTQTGQDVFAQLAHATRGSLIIGLTVGVLAILFSAVFGIIGAYVGGWVDEGFSLFSNIMLVIPGLPLVIVISSYVQQKGILLISLVLAVTSWAGAARVLRAVTLSVRSRDYVLASPVAGERTWRILFVEIMPNLVPLLASMFIFAVIGAILGEAGLAFIGLGASNSWTWGTMLFWAGNGLALRLGALWWFVPPGLLIALFGAGLAMINFAIDEIINPKLRNQGASAVRRRRTKEAR
ncbi:ABC transporter permease [Pseudonocardia nigra]|uniref:ABC transporter permease n=1 Tax=Pseudonocardia nigra TaxID=1921578 RepID=UPI001FE34E13|nr:ABC transporter permease [Pseudonocardia nigra]